MAGVVTHGVATASTTNASSYVSGAFTPALGDLLVVFAVATGAGTATPTLTGTGGITFTLLTQTVKGGTGADQLSAFVADSPAHAVSQTVTLAPGASSTGAVIEVIRIAGIALTGSGVFQSAVRQSNVKTSLAVTGTAPSVVLGAACLTGNVILAFASNAASPATMTPPSGFTEQSDVGYSTPTTGAEYATINSGFTGSTVTWGATSSTAWGAIAIEIQVAPGSSAISTLSDNFDDGTRNTTLWNLVSSVGTATETSGQLQIAPSATATDYPGYNAVHVYDLTDSSIRWQMLPLSSWAVPANQGDIDFAIIWGTGFLYNTFLAGPFGGTITLGFTHSIAGASTTLFTTTYSPTTHAWMRVRHSTASGLVFFETSSDGSTWTTQFSEAPAFTITALLPQPSAGIYVNTASPGTAAFDNVDAINGAVAATLASVTSAATGTLATGVNGAVAVTLANVTSAAAGTLAIAGVVADALASVTLASAATLALSGSVADTLAPATVSSTATIASVTGTVADTLASVALTSTAALAIAGTAADALAPATLASTATLTLSGAAADALAPTTVSSTATLAVTGAAAEILAPVALASVAVLAITGAVADALAPATLASVAVLALTGTAADSLAPVMVSSAATLALKGSAADVLAPATLASAATLALTGSVADALAPVTLLSVATLAITGTAADALAPTTLASAAVLALTGAAADALAPVTLISIATLAIAGTAADALDSMTLASAAVLALAGSAADALTPVALVSAATLAIAGAAADTLDAIALASTGAGAVTIAGTVADVLDPVTLNSASTLALAGAVADALDPVALSAAGVVLLTASASVLLDDSALVAIGKVLLAGSASILLDDCTIIAAGTGGQATAISAKHRAWLQALARVHALIDPLAVSSTTRQDGTVFQTIAEAGGAVTVTPTTVPTGADGVSALASDEAAWLEALVRVHGLVDPLVVTTAGRDDGTLVQTFSLTGGVTTITRTA